MIRAVLRNTSEYFQTNQTDHAGEQSLASDQTPRAQSHTMNQNFGQEWSVPREQNEKHDRLRESLHVSSVIQEDKQSGRDMLSERDVRVETHLNVLPVVLDAPSPGPQRKELGHD